MDRLAATLVIKALDGLSARSVATAQNIANAGTAGYRPLRVSFEQALAGAAPLGPGAIAAVQPRLQTAGAGEGDLRLDLELATASSTALRYAALIEVLNRQLQLDSLAATGNG